VSGLADTLRSLLAARFPDRGIEFRTGTKYGPGIHVAHIPCPSGVAGDIDIEVDEEIPYPEVTIFFDEPTGGHIHLVQYGPSDADPLEQCCDFLENVFSGRYVMFEDGFAYPPDDASIERVMKLNPGRYVATWTRVLQGDRPGGSS
jgi:hypothetical protein